MNVKLLIIITVINLTTQMVYSEEFKPFVCYTNGMEAEAHVSKYYDPIYCQEGGCMDVNVKFKGILNDYLVHPSEGIEEIAFPANFNKNGNALIYATRYGTKKLIFRDDIATYIDIDHKGIVNRTWKFTGGCYSLGK